MTGSTWLDLLRTAIGVHNLTDRDVSIDEMRGLLVLAEKEAAQKGKDLLREVWAGQSRIHAETADEYAERSHEVAPDLADAYSALSEAHRQLSDALRLKAGKQIDADFDFNSAPHPSAHYERGE